MSTDSERIEIPGRSGVAVRISAGAAIEIINTFGHQVVDFWAFMDSNINRYLSMSHSRAVLNRISPRSGDTLVDNERQPIIRIERDSFNGMHDTIIPPCDKYRYELLGCNEYHENCVDNMFWRNEGPGNIAKLLSSIAEFMDEYTG